MPTITKRGNEFASLLNPYIGTMKYPDGRTMHEASEAGDSYQIRCGSHAGLWMPGCAGIQETLAAARKQWPDCIGKTAYLYRVLPGSKIGAMVLEPSCTAVL